MYFGLNFLVFGLYAIDPKLMAVDYAFMAVPVLVIPLIIEYHYRTKLLKHVLLPTAFFAAVFFIYETVSLCIGSWWWPGEYLWPAQLCGVTFPLDDVFIWYVLSAPALIGGYEYFAVGTERKEGGWPRLRIRPKRKA